MSKSGKSFAVQFVGATQPKQRSEWNAGSSNVWTSLKVDDPSQSPVLRFQPNSGAQSWSYTWVGGEYPQNLSNGCYNIDILQPANAASSMSFNIASDPLIPQFVVQFDSSGRLYYPVILELTPTRVNVRQGTSC